MRSLKRIGWNASVRFLFLWGRLANFSFSVKAVESFRGLSSLPVIFSAHARELSNQNRLQSSVFLFVVCFHGTCTRDLHIRRYLSSFGSEICHRGDSVGLLTAKYRKRKEKRQQESLDLQWKQNGKSHKCHMKSIKHCLSPRCFAPRQRRDRIVFRCNWGSIRYFRTKLTQMIDMTIRISFIEEKKFGQNFHAMV